ncbi:hypothetical protein VWM68_11390, partial [Campylobacter coli]
AKVIKHLKTSAYLAPASACVRMLESIRSGEFLPMSVILHGEFQELELDYFDFEEFVSISRKNLPINNLVGLFLQSGRSKLGEK